MGATRGKKGPEQGPETSDLKQDIARLREEIKSFSSMILSDRMEGIERTLRLNHLKVYVDREAGLVDECASRCVNVDCSNHGSCQKSFFKSIGAALVGSSDDDIGDVIERIDDELERIEDNIKIKTGKTCVSCFGNVRDELVRHRQALNLISKPGLREYGGKRVLDLEKISELVLKPLASPVRLRILTSLYQGRRSFSELASETGLKGGHLIFHMNQLVESGFIVQDGRKGDYVITEKGFNILEKLNSL